MVSRGSLFRSLAFSPKRIHIFHAVFLLSCLVGCYLFVMSYLLMSEMGSQFRTWEKLREIVHNEGPNRAPEASVPEKSSELADGTLKTILFWNPFFTSLDYHFGIGRSPFLQNNCSVNTCSVTTVKSFMNTADVIVFHTPEVGPLPNYRPPNQKYVFVQREPHYPRSKQVLGYFNDMFNLTMTYRYDSDIPIPYGKVVNRTQYPEQYNTYPPETKTGQIVWVVSHCNSLGRREMYMDELMKYISVDIYGDCGNLTCNKSDVVGCLHKLEMEYRLVSVSERKLVRRLVSE